MSTSHPLRDRLQSNSPDPDLARPTTPLRINKQPPRQGLSPRQPGSQIQVHVARRSSNSFKHVRENNLVTKSPFRTLIPQAVPLSPSPRRVSGEKRPRPSSMQAQAENEKPLGFKRRQSKAFQGLLQKEPVTKSPFRHPSDATSSDDLPPPVPPKLTPRKTAPFIVPSPVRGVLSNPRKMHGPRSVGERQHQKQKTVTFDERCDVLEFDRNEDELEDVSYDENGYGYGYSYDHDDQDVYMDESVDSSSQVAEDSITGLVDSMLQASLPHTPPRPEDEDDVGLLPPSPSPAKPSQPSSPHSQGSLSHSPRPSTEHYSHPQIKDEDPPFEESFRSNDSLDPANLSIGNSEVSISNLDSHSLLVDGSLNSDVLTAAEFAPIAGSSPRPRPRSRSATPLEPSLDHSFDRSFEARSTPSITPSRFNSPRSESESSFHRQLFKPSSTSSLGSATSPRASPHTPITRAAVQERLLRRRSEDPLVASRSASASPAPAPTEETVDDAADASQATEPAEEPLPALPMMARTNPTHDGVMSIDPDPQPIDPPRPTLTERAHSVGTMDVKHAFAGLELDFEHGFGLGEEGMSVSAGLGVGMNARAKHSGVHLGDVSALDKLMEDMAQGAGIPATANTSLMSEGQSYASLRIEQVTEGVKAAAFSPSGDAQEDGDTQINVDSGPDEVPARANHIPTPSPSTSPPLPPPPAEDAIRNREELVKARKRETVSRSKTLTSFEDNSSPVAKQFTTEQRRPTSSRDEDLLDITALRGQEAPLADTINRELKKRENTKRSNYHVREHQETIYASSDGDRTSHANGDTGADTDKAWRSIRRPSDMFVKNEYSKQLRELREKQKTGQAHGKVFVKVVGLRGLDVPVPEQPTRVTCTLNNGIHFVTTPETPLGRDCTIDQEFELIEHSKLEFTLTIKVRRDPHIVAQMKANQPPAPAPRPAPQPLPPPASKGGNSKGGGMRSFLGLGSPKKSKVAQREASPAPVPLPPPVSTFTLRENLARYLKPDGSLGRAFITFKDIAQHCDTRLMETAFPLIGQKIEAGSSAKALQVGEIVLQIFRLPPLPGIPADQLPQSLEECHRGLTYTRWHKSCYMQGTLTQIGGDCTTWRRRHLRIIGCSLVAYNDVTRRAIASIDLRKATRVEDDSSPVRSPASEAVEYDDTGPYGIGGVERSFKLQFGTEQILFYADTDEEKEDWVKLLTGLIGRIPPNPLWAELLFQRQEQTKQATQA